MSVSVNALPTSNSYREIFLAVEPLYNILNTVLNEDNTPPTEIEPIALNPNLSPDHPLTKLCDRLNLEECERDILLLCLLLELKPQLKFASSHLQQDPDLTSVTFNLAKILLCSFTSKVFKARSPLNYWQLIETTSDRLLTESPLKLDRFILCYLFGEDDLDRELEDTVYPLSAASTNSFPLPEKYQAIAEKIAELNPAISLNADIPLIELCGSDRATRRHIAATVCQTWQRPLYRTSPLSLPLNAKNLPQWLRRWERQALLTQSLLLLEIDPRHNIEDAKKASLWQFIAECRTPILISTPEELNLNEREKIAIEIPPLAFPERKAIWSNCLGDRAHSLNRTIERIADNFALPPQSIATICQQIPPLDSPEDLSAHLWQNCRIHARDRLKFLAQRVETPLTWDDLILPEKTKETLQQILNTARARFQVYHQWGLTQKRPRGLGICALFSGYSGTGKTTAAEIIAQELNLDCYRVDLSAIVSKYIGETEKNLRQIFDAAEGGGVVLLFDEADALFSKRGEIKEARDRYANQEVSYLLQRIETYPGLTILTTNLKHTIDSAFERRLKFIVDFPKPTYWERKDMWERMYPPQTPTEGLNYDRLPKLNVSGGNLANVALEAAFLAAAEGEAVQMKHLLAAAKADAKRMGRDIHDSETEKWV